MSSRWLETMIAKHGSKEAVSEWMAENGRKHKGQKLPTSGVASLSPEERSRRGREAANAKWAKERERKLKEKS